MKKLITLVGLLTTLSVVGQDFVSGTKYLYGKTSFTNYSVAVLNVEGTSEDTTFIDYGSQKYTYINEKLFVSDSVLSFDYGAKEGDTIVYDNIGFVEKIKVDSIRDIQLQNGLVYTHFFARHTTSNQQYVVIKGIGEVSLGLAPLNTITIPEFVGVKSVCRDDSLIYWRGDGDTTCNYDSFLALIGVAEQAIFLMLYTLTRQALG